MELRRIEWVLRVGEKIFNAGVVCCWMVDYGKRYQGIVDKLVMKSYLELEGKDINVGEMGKLRSGFCSAVTDYFIWFIFLKVSRGVRDFSRKEIEGLLAHELGHVVRFEQCSFFGKLWKGFRYFVSGKFREQEERACDVVAVERGYGRGLYLFRKRRGANCFYLSAEEIRKHAKKIGKW